MDGMEIYKQYLLLIGTRLDLPVSHDHQLEAFSLAMQFPDYNVVPCSPL